MRSSYPDAWFLSRKTAGGLTPPMNRFLTPLRAVSASAQHIDNLSACTGHAHDRPRSRPSTPLSCAAGRKPSGAYPTTPRTPHTSCAPRTHHPVRTQHSARTWPPPAHTKRARTNRSGRATYSAQALGRLPWFAPCLRRSRRLRPRFDMSFSLGLLSRLKHFCTHWPKPPRHNTSPATKVTEKRAAAPASSADVTPRGRALSQRVQRQVTDTLVIEATTRARSASEACSVS